MNPLTCLPKRAGLWLSLLSMASGVAASAETTQTLLLQTRSQKQTSSGRGDYQTLAQSARWDPKQTALILCDVWDQHWCRGASARVAELARTMNEVVKEARRRGVFIVHSPSGTMKFYQDTPQRRRAQQAPKAEAPIPLGGWCSLNLAQEGPLPIDDADGGCDCEPKCPSGAPWTRQIAMIEIAPEDAISDSGQEIYNLFTQKGIQNVILMGVHANMCVLGRPFGIRQQVRLGKNVVLMRDMTDTMYNSRARPFVSHFRGTDLIMDHIERHWCPTLTSTAFTGRPPIHFQADRRPKIALVIGEQEYDAKHTLPAFAQAELAYRFGFDCFVIQSDKTDDLPGLDKLEQADLAILYLRRRTLPPAQMAHILHYVDAGRPLVALRTSSHAFQNWNFDHEVLGGTYTGHYANQGPGAPATVVWPLPEAASHPILRGIPHQEFSVGSTLYKSSPLARSATPLMLGRVGEGHPPEPVAWTFQNFARARVFYTSLGHPEDFKLEPFRRLLRNGVLWALDFPIRPTPVLTAAAGDAAR